MTRWSAGLFALLLGALALALATDRSRAADHRDGPRVKLDDKADINDVYLFVSPNNNANVVFAMTVDPFVVPGIDATFAPEVLYQFKIDNTGDFREDLVIQALFSSAPNQRLTVLGPARPSKLGGSNQILNLQRYGSATGPADGRTVSGRNGMQASAGLSDDPFFFDLVYVFRELGVLPGGPLTRSPGIDFFSGMNTLAFVVEVPITAVKGQTNKIGVWATTSRPKTTKRSSSRDERGTPPYVQIERMGFPIVNTLLVDLARKDLFNRSVPTTDRSLFLDGAVAKLLPFNGDRTYSTEIANVLLPDVLPLDVTSTKGFPDLNGRRLSDDVVDIILSVASRRGRGDNVNGNDVPFRSTFPYIGLPHDPSETIPRRN